MGKGWSVGRGQTLEDLACSGLSSTLVSGWLSLECIQVINMFKKKKVASKKAKMLDTGGFIEGNNLVASTKWISDIGLF